MGDLDEVTTAVISDETEAAQVEADFVRQDVPFLILPLEIRQIIYRLLFNFHTLVAGYSDAYLASELYRQEYHLQKSLLQTCRQIHVEWEKTFALQQLVIGKLEQSSIETFDFDGTPEVFSGVRTLTVLWSAWRTKEWNQMLKWLPSVEKIEIILDEVNIQRWSKPFFIWPSQRKYLLGHHTNRETFTAALQDLYIKVIGDKDQRNILSFPGKKWFKLTRRPKFIVKIRGLIDEEQYFRASGSAEFSHGKYKTFRRLRDYWVLDVTIDWKTIKVIDAQSSTHEGPGLGLEFRSYPKLWQW